MRQDALLGTITVEEADFPWLHGSFAPEPGFAEVKPWFDAVLAAVEAEAYDERFDAAYASIAESLTLLSPAGPVAEFLLHIEGGAAWFRWIEEPDAGPEGEGGERA
ncbi:hypothetical protein [Streptomyces sp. NPDC060031]|uniref:hypothetical protein n=1 Tax=Streptomyces sp. NPDC060031 TaxID=3347043 RepID=UPI0036B06558